eukprot:TRINITY_DN7135_c1_g1_i1.p1 TRINITY_DN7135_c1_g1~~TRINITY_DN7135_c1_g1_i1.p1  ORF type:complete len:873 (+),score=174.96 TRINITY_DN7135_c1_g1_i1:329-2947(+)
MAESPSRKDDVSEAEAHLSANAALAKEAASLFQTRRYQECLDILYQLMQRKPDDPKILHNIAVVEYLRDGCVEPQKLLQRLDKVKSSSEELNHSTGEQLDLTGISSNNSNLPAAKGTGISSSGQTVAPSNCEGISYVAECDTSIAILNTAIILYNLQQYASAMSVLEPLFQNIEPIDETAALRICLLMLDIALASHQAAKAADVIRYMEKAFGFAYSAQTTEGGSSSQSQSSIQTSSNLKGMVTNQTNLLAAESSGGATATHPVGSTTTMDGSLHNPLYDNVDYENFISTLDSDNQSIGRPDVVRTAVERPPPASGIKLILHLYKVRLLLLTRNLKATKREVKMAMKIARGRDASIALLLKAQLEYSRGNNHKAIKLLTTCFSRSEQGSSCVFWNNLGCIHHRLKKDQLASFYFKKAYQNSVSHCTDHTMKLTKFSQDKSQSIMYNLGMMNLITGNPTIAAECFQKACSLYYFKPLLWIRLAECCILAHRRGLIKNSNGLVPKEDELKIQLIGSGKWRYIVLPTVGMPAISSAESKDSTGMDSDDMNCSNNEEFFTLDKPVKISMCFARQCLRNALWLLSCNDRDQVDHEAGEMQCERKDEEDPSQSAIGYKNMNQKSLGTLESKGTGSIPTFPTQMNINGDLRESKGNSSLNNSLSSSVEAYEEMCRKEHLSAWHSVMAELAYVELCLKNPLKALATAETLLKQPNCSRSYVYLGRVYAAEALCHLNRPNEAAEHLLACIEDGGNADSFNAVNEESQKWRSTENSEASGDGDETIPSSFCTSSVARNTQVSSVDEGHARTTLYANLAAASALQGELDRAHQYGTDAVSFSPTNTLALLAVVYVELIQGKTQEAISKLKHCQQLRVMFPNLA